MPNMQKYVAVTDAFESQRVIRLYTDPEIAKLFSQFGTITADERILNFYTLIVDARYDFREVLDFVGTYRPEPT